MFKFINKNPKLNTYISLIIMIILNLFLQMIKVSPYFEVIVILFFIVNVYWGISIITWIKHIKNNI